MALQVTAYGAGEDPSSKLSWPSCIGHGAGDVFRLSESTNFNIDPFSHLFVVNYDTGVAPRDVQINLPNLGLLPNRSHLYFVYIENSLDTDTLTFTVVAGSDNTVNQDPVSKTFTLDGQIRLYIVAGFGEKWIVFPFGSLVNPTPPPPPYIPYTYYNFSPCVRFSSDITEIYFNDTPPYVWTDPTTYQFMSVAFFDPTETVIHTGMEGYMTQAGFFAQGQAISGFQCHHTGWYRVDLNGYFNIRPTANPIYDYQSRFYLYTAAGDVKPSPVISSIGNNPWRSIPPDTCYTYVSSSVVLYIEDTDYMAWYNLYGSLSPKETMQIWEDTWYTITFTLLHAEPAPPPVMLMSSSSSISAPRQSLAAAAAPSSSSSSSSEPTISEIQAVIQRSLQESLLKRKRVS